MENKGKPGDSQMDGLIRLLTEKAAQNRNGKTKSDEPDFFEKPKDLKKVISSISDVDRRIDNMKYLLEAKISERSRLIGLAQEILGRTEARIKFIEFDARRDPKTKRWCIMCQKDIKPGAKARFVRFVDIGGGPYAIHPDDVEYIESGVLALPANAVRHEDQVIGSDCARKLGLEWTIAEVPTENA